MKNKWDKLPFINKKFRPIWDDNSRLLLLHGGYGSGKTTFAITRQLWKSMNNKFHRCYYGRYSKIEARQLHSNIIREIKRNRWEDLFNFSEQREGSTEITCIKTGNCFRMFGVDDNDSLINIDNATDILIDEVEQISFGAFVMLLTRLRLPEKRAKMQIVGIFNNCDVYKKHWLRKYVFGSEIPKEEMARRLVACFGGKMTFNTHHSNYMDNEKINQEEYESSLFIASGGNKRRFKELSLGLWKK